MAVLSEIRQRPLLLFTLYYITSWRTLSVSVSASGRKSQFT